MSLDLIQIFKGYVNNYHTFNLTYTHTLHSFTMRELNYFFDLGIHLGYYPFTEDGADGDCRAMDLSWWTGWDQEAEEWEILELHLERENLPDKDEETLNKLFNQKRNYPPQYMIGILTVKDLDRVNHLNKIASKMIKSGEALLIYYISKKIIDNYDIQGYLIKNHTISQAIKAIQKEDEDTGVLQLVLKDLY